jgi:hypothetical protein
VANNIAFRACCSEIVERPVCYADDVSGNERRAFGRRHFRIPSLSVCGVLRLSTQ